MENPELIPTKVIAKALIVSPHTVRKWKQRYSDFPAPVRKEGKQLLFDAKAVWLWAVASGRAPAQLVAELAPAA